MPSRCEYKILPESEMTAGPGGSVQQRLGEKLKELGEHGWELAVVRPQPEGEDLWVFKRPASTLTKATDEVAASLQRLIDTGRAVAARTQTGGAATGSGSVVEFPTPESPPDSPNEAPGAPEAPAPAT